MYSEVGLPGICWSDVTCFHLFFHEAVAGRHVSPSIVVCAQRKRTSNVLEHFQFFEDVFWDVLGNKLEPLGNLLGNPQNSGTIQDKSEK